MNLIISKGIRKPETEAKHPYDEVMTLKMAIEEAIIKGQKSSGAISNIMKSGIIHNEELDLSEVDRGWGVVGWIDDL